ncbi:MAG: uroporphyrinogen-III synthase [Wenzhouxiangellaceae bacterium]|nr:uroporphyrinogen-III synthase [Wenzhouxiangellaceae bacterium]
MANENPTIVVTRPAPDHAALLEALAARGLAAAHSPAFRIAPAEAGALDAALEGLQRFDRIVVTSPAAARILADRVGRPGRPGPGLVAPGRGTAAILEAAGLDVVHPENGGTSEHVLALPELQRVAGLTIAIVGAPGGRDAIRRELADRGADVRRLQIYRRVPMPPAAALVEALEARCPLIVLISSLKAFEELTAALKPELREAWLGAQFIVSSQRLASACRAAGATGIRCAAGAGNHDMLDALDRALRETANSGGLDDLGPGN